MDERYDELLMMVISQCSGIQGFFDIVFRFLRRRTDFFVLSKPGDKAGFPPGAAEQIIMRAFSEVRQEYLKEHPFDFEQYKNSLPSKVEQVQEIPEESKEQPVQEKPQEEFFQEQIPRPKASNEISTDNGGQTDKYLWQQDITFITMQIKLPPNTRARDLLVKMQTMYLSVALKSDPNNPIVEGTLFERIHPDDSFWQIDDGTIVLNLSKANDTIWQTVIRGDAEIDPKTVDNSRRVDEYDEDTQTGIRKVMYENERKMRGLPTTDEELAQQRLQEFWQTTPYKDQPFDPALLAQMSQDKQDE